MIHDLVVQYDTDHLDTHVIKMLAGTISTHKTWEYDIQETSGITQS